MTSQRKTSTQVLHFVVGNLCFLGQRNMIFFILRIETGGCKKQIFHISQILRHTIVQTLTSLYTELSSVTIPGQA